MPLWFDGWDDLRRVVIIGPAAFVALGSTLTTILLSLTIGCSEGVLALAVLVALQHVVTWASTRGRLVRRLVRNEPAPLCSGGFLDGAMRSQRVTHDEVRQAARSQGHASPDGVKAVVLETDGTFSILTSELASDRL